MLTRTAPAFYRAAQGTMDPAAIQAISQSMMNCAQPLQHRGSVSFARPQAGQSGGAINSVGWNPADYQNLFPQGGVSSNQFNEMPGNGGYTAGDWVSTFYGGPYFDLSTELQQNLNQYYSGPTVTVQGDTHLQNVYNDNTVTNNLTVQNINGQPAPGAPGTAGPAGPQGQNGLDGLPGPGVFVTQYTINPVRPLWQRIWILERRLLRLSHYAGDIDSRLRSLRIVGWPQGSTVLTDAKLNEEYCRVDATGRAVVLRIRGNV